MSEVTACFNCGLPSNCTSGGRKVSLEIQPQNRFHRGSRRTVWCHSDECAYQALAAAKYGPASHKWPITLVQFRGMNPLPPQERSHRYETPSEQVIVSMGCGGQNSILVPQAQSEFRNAKQARGGRPRKHRNAAEKQRVYRQRSQDRLLDPAAARPKGSFGKMGPAPSGECPVDLGEQER